MSNQQKDIPLKSQKVANQNLAESIKKMYLNTKSCDTQFLFGSNDDDGAVKRVAAHKGVLAAGSDVFDTMFYGELKETGDIQITDSSEAAFMEFLQFFYLNEVELTEENIAEVMYLGQKYNVANCINACVEFFKKNLNTENIFGCLELAFLYNQHDLVKFCEKTIISDTVAVLKSADFLNCNKMALDHILKMDLLSCTEAEVFEACMAWVKAKSGQTVLSKKIVEAHLGELFHKIRFAAMKMEHLCAFLMEYGSVLRDDLETIIQMISVAGYQSDKFNVNPRHAKWNEDAVIECERALSKEYLTKFIDLYTKEKTVFSSNEPLLFGSFTCEQIAFGGECSVTDLEKVWPVDVEVIEADNLDNDANTKVVSNLKAQLQSRIIKIQLPQPILIRPGHFYIIYIGPFPAEYRFQSKHLKSKVKLENEIAIQFHSNYEWTDKIIGFIPTLDFNRI